MKYQKTVFSSHLFFYCNISLESSSVDDAIKNTLNRVFQLNFCPNLWSKVSIKDFPQNKDIKVKTYTCLYQEGNGDENGEDEHATESVKM